MLLIGNSHRLINYEQKSDTLLQQIFNYDNLIGTNNIPKKIHENIPKEIHDGTTELLWACRHNFIDIVRRYLS